MGQHVATCDILPKPLPYVVPDCDRHVDAAVVAEELGGIVEPLEDVDFAADGVCGIGGADVELIASEHLEEPDDVLHRVGGKAVEDSRGASGIPLVGRQVLFERERLAARFDASRTVSVAARGPHTGQKALAP